MLSQSSWKLIYSDYFPSQWYNKSQCLVNSFYKKKIRKDFTLIIMPQSYPTTKRSTKMAALHRNHLLSSKVDLNGWLTSTKVIHTFLIATLWDDNFKDQDNHDTVGVETVEMALEF